MITSKYRSIFSSPKLGNATAVPLSYVALGFILGAIQALTGDGFIHINGQTSYLLGMTKNDYKCGSCSTICSHFAGAKRVS